MWTKYLLLLVALTKVSGFNGNCIGGIQNVDGFVKAPEKFKAGLGEFPWVVALFKRGQVKPFCAGSLIQNDIVLTTAFCVQKYSPSDISVKAGLWDLNNTDIQDYKSKGRKVVSIVTHAEYTSDPIDNDIAIIRLEKPFKDKKHIQKICIDDGSVKVSTKGCLLTGWGAEKYESKDQLSQFLKKIPMDFVDHLECENILKSKLNTKFFLTDSFLCAKGGEHDACVGDSGAPLSCPLVGESNIFVLSAISSYGIRCNESPSVYTNLQKFADWIKDHSEIPAPY